MKLNLERPWQTLVHSKEHTGHYALRLSAKTWQVALHAHWWPFYAYEWKAKDPTTRMLLVGPLSLYLHKPRPWNLPGYMRKF